MKALIRSELLKLRTTRTVYYLFGGIVALAFVTVLDPGHSAESFQKPFNEQTFVFFASMLTRLLILVLGIRLMTDEFRHGSIVPTLLSSPRRGRVLAAKAGVGAVVGMFAAVVGWVVMTGAASLVASSEGTTLTLDAAAWRTLVGTVGAGVLWGTIGVFVGAIIRNQLVATIGGLLWLMAIEDTVRGFLGDAGGYLPGQAGLALILAPNGVGMGTILATLAAYLVTFGFVAARSMRRDIA